MSTSTAGNLPLYERLVGMLAGVERKGAAMPYTSVNGNMFTFLTKAGKVAIRLPEDARNEFIEKHGAAQCEQHGTLLKEYVETPDALLAKTTVMKKYFEISYAYAKSLKPKPARKKAAKKSAAKRAGKNKK